MYNATIVNGVMNDESLVQKGVLFTQVVTIFVGENDYEMQVVKVSSYDGILTGEMLDRVLEIAKILKLGYYVQDGSIFLVGK